MFQFLLQLYHPRHREKNPNYLAIKTMTDNFPPLGVTDGEKRRTQLRKLPKTSVEHIAETLLNKYQTPSTELQFNYSETYPT